MEKKVKKCISISKKAMKVIDNSGEKTSRFIERAVMERINDISTTKKIAFANLKGKVGKTTITHNFIHILAAAGKKVLAVDLDVQGNLTSSLGYYDLEKKSILDLLNKGCKVEDVVVHVNENIDLIPSNLKLIKFMIGGIKGLLALKNAMKKVNMPQYDFVVFDCAPRLDVLNTSVFSVANSVYVPLSPGKFPVEGINILESVIKDAVDMYENDVKIKGVFLNLYKNNSISNYSYDKIHEEFKGKALKTKVRDLVEVAKTQFMEKSLFEADGNAKKDLVDLVNEILEREGVDPIEV